MKAAVVVVLVLIAGYVKLNVIDDEIDKFDGNRYFVYSIAHGNLHTLEVLKGCFNMKFTHLNSLNFKGSEYLFKLLRAAYFYDLKTIELGSPKPNSVFQQALDSYNNDFKAPPISDDQSDRIGGYSNLPFPRECKIEPKKINELIVSKLSDKCVFPKAIGGLFAEYDFKDMNVDIPACSDMLNGIMDRIISRFKQITSDSQIDINPYTEALKLVFLINVNHLIRGYADMNISKLRILLLNEFLIAKMSSNLDLLKTKKEELNNFMDRILKGMDTSEISTQYKAGNIKIAKDGVTYLNSIILNTELSAEEKQTKEKIIGDLLTDLGINYNILLI